MNLIITIFGKAILFIGLIVLGLIIRYFPALFSGEHFKVNDPSCWLGLCCIIMVEILYIAIFIYGVYVLFLPSDVLLSIQ